jgi:hypothetical protein
MKYLHDRIEKYIKEHCQKYSYSTIPKATDIRNGLKQYGENNSLEV